MRLDSKVDSVEYDAFVEVFVFKRIERNVDLKIHLLYQKVVRTFTLGISGVIL